MMRNNSFPVAAGKTEDMKKLKEALFKMFAFEFKVDTYSEKESVLYANSYTFDAETEKRRPLIVKAVKELSEKFEIPVVINFYDGYVEPENMKPEKNIDENEIAAIFGVTSGQMGGQ